jgi:hypothetical protein
MSDPAQENPAELAAETPPESPEISVDEHGIPDDAYVYALEQLLKGRKPKEIRKSLAEAGYTPNQLDKIIQYATNYRSQHDADPVGPAGGAMAPIVIGLMLWVGGAMAKYAGIRGMEASFVFLLTDIAGLVLIIIGVVRFVRGRRARK